MDNPQREDDFGSIVVNNFGEHYFYAINRDCFARTSAQTLYANKFAKILFNENVLNVIVGTDSGLLPQYIQNTKLPKGSRYLFIEPETVLSALQNRHMLTGLDEERIRCISLTDWSETISQFKIQDYLYINAVHSCNAFCAEDDHIQLYAEISWHITEVLSQMHWLNAVELGAESFVTRQLENIADHILPAQSLAHAFKDKTVVLLAGGPSLDLALPWVQQHRQQCVVFAVSRISRQLLQQGIEPDFVFSVDPTELSFDISKEMLNFSQRTQFVCSHHTVPALINQWTGRLFYLGDRLPWKSDLNVKNISSAGPTVTNTAINVAHHFGFKRIILVGVDLCFTKEGFTHAKGSDEDIAGPRFNLTSLQVETNTGLMAPTSCDFSQAILSLGVQAQLLAENGCKLINVSGQAAKINAVDYIPLTDLALTDQAIDVQSVLSAHLAKQVNVPVMLNKILDEFKRVRFQIKAIATLAENAKQINNEMYNAEGIIENYKDKHRLDKIEKKFKREYRQFTRLVKSFGIRRFIKLAKPFSDEEWTAEEAKELGSVFYDAYLEGTALLLSLLDQAIERTQSRLEEYKVQPNVDRLIAQARKDHSYGRVRLWQLKFPQLMLTEQQQAIFCEFEQRFLDVLNNRQTKHFASAQKRSSLSTLKQRAALLFKHKKIEDLQALLSGLDRHQEQQAAIPYRYLLNAYIAEINNQPDTALDAYQQIVIEADVLLEEALSRIANISIDQDNSASAQLALQCLAQINPSYLPLYAEILRLQDEPLQAIDAYNRYIALFPDDSLIQLKLAMLYIEQKIYAAAEIMLNYVLQKSPELSMALTVKQQLQALIATENCLPAHG